ncbi:hypothetical protein KA107_00395 [Candidatus Pacearchaeota archaeon]|nr:hypothetical protein [Candidatus Pacearchaeota archaeon]
MVTERDRVGGWTDDSEISTDLNARILHSFLGDKWAEKDFFGRRKMWRMSIYGAFQDELKGSGKGEPRGLYAALSRQTDDLENRGVIGCTTYHANGNHIYVMPAQTERTLLAIWNEPADGLTASKCPRIPHELNLRILDSFFDTWSERDIFGRRKTDSSMISNSVSEAGAIKIDFLGPRGFYNSIKEQTDDLENRGVIVCTKHGRRGNNQYFMPKQTERTVLALRQKN